MTWSCQRFTFALYLSGLTLLLAGCAEHQAKTQGQLIVFVVRHAEKASSPPSDPPLSSVGKARAQRLTMSIGAEPISAVYATAYRRTRQTALPTAQMHSIGITSYDAAQSPAAFVAELRRMHSSGRVLVVGHSNTVPEIVSALCHCAVPAMDEDEYNRLSTVHLNANGSASLESTAY